MPLPGVKPYKKEDADKYTRMRWWPGLTLGDLVDKAADLYPNREALVDSKQRLTYSELREKANRVAIGLINAGVKPLDRVLIQLPNWSEFVYTYFGVQKAGAIAVLLLPRHSVNEINHLCKLTEATTWIVPEKYQKIDYNPIIDQVKAANPSLKNVILVRSTENSKKLPTLEDMIDKADMSESNMEILAERRPDPGEPAHFGPTGGSTGLPKVGVRTHNVHICRSEYIAHALEMNGDDVNLIVAPSSHDLTFSNAITTAIFTFGKLVMLDSTDMGDIMEAVQNEKVTVITWVPTLADRMLNFEKLKDYDISSLRIMNCGGQLSPEKLVRDVNEILGCKYVNGYGGTEGQQSMTRLDYDLSLVHTCVGRPACPYDTYKVIDESGNELGPDQPGELVIKGPCVFTGYFNAPEENANAFTKDGFFRTGDKVIINSKTGNITIVGRIKDTIKRGGENISPIEIENLARNCPDIADIAVVGMPDPVLSERICAYVQLKPGSKMDLPQLVAYLKSQGASVLQLPERLEIVDALPLTKANKTDKKLLREEITKKLIAEGKIKPE